MFCKATISIYNKQDYKAVVPVSSRRGLNCVLPWFVSHEPYKRGLLLFKLPWFVSHETQ